MPFTVPEKVCRELFMVRLEKFVTVQKFGPELLRVLALPRNVTLTLVLLMSTPCRRPPTFRLIENVNGVAPGKSVAAAPMVICVPVGRAVEAPVPAPAVLQFRPFPPLSSAVPKP